MSNIIKPKLEFNYSWIYDQMIHEWQGKKYGGYSPKIERYKNRLEKEWRKIERKAFDVISEVSGLKWKKPVIDCYIVEETKCFSMPLTIEPRKKLKNLIKTIIHELVHNIIVQNLDRLRQKNYSKKYGKLSRKTEIHILVHAILKEALLKLYGEKQTRKLIESYDKYPKDYRKAWEIVEQEGSRKIIIDGIR